MTIPYTEFQAIQNRAREAERKLAEVEQRTRDLRIAECDAASLTVARNALEVVRYAVANLPAESNKDWPTNALHAIAKALPSLPDATVDDRELATTIDYFATEAERFEERRRALGSKLVHAGQNQ